MKAYASDCAKVAQVCDEGAASRRQLARQFRVSVAFSQQMRRSRQLTGRLAAAAHTGGRRGALDAEARALVARLIREQNALPLAEVCERVAAEQGGHVSVPTMDRAVHRLRRPDNKSCSLPPRVRAARARCRALSATLDLRRVKCIDGAGSKLAMPRLYGRAPRGERALGRAPQHDGQHVTIDIGCAVFDRSMSKLRAIQPEIRAQFVGGDLTPFGSVGPNELARVVAFTFSTACIRTCPDVRSFSPTTGTLLAAPRPRIPDRLPPT